jgi:hypothetical protein
MAGARPMTVMCWERATPAALIVRFNAKEDAPLEWRAPSKESER